MLAILCDTQKYLSCMLFFLYINKSTFNCVVHIPFWKIEYFPIYRGNTCADLQLAWLSLLQANLRLKASIAKSTASFCELSRIVELTASLCKPVASLAELAASLCKLTASLTELAASIPKPAASFCEVSRIAQLTASSSKLDWTCRKYSQAYSKLLWGFKKG